MLFLLKNLDTAIKWVFGKPISVKQRQKLKESFLNLIENSMHLKRHELLNYSKEYDENIQLKNHFENSLKKFADSGAFNPTFQGVLYSLIRWSKPRIVIETGVANGVSTTIILTALELNNDGKLFSVDLPVKKWEESEYRKEDHVKVKNDRVGWLVPEQLQHRWKLELGESRKILLDILDHNKTCDFFLHDSEHSYENMKFELNSCWKHLTKNGIIIADDINRNNAFSEFVKTNKDKTVSLQLGQIGIIIKK